MTSSLSHNTSKQISYSIVIDRISGTIIDDLLRFNGVRYFMNRSIPISLRLYADLKEYPDIMLLVDHPESETLIPGFNTYFQHDIDISYLSEEQIGNEVIVRCVLNDIACFSSDHPGTPF